MRDPGLARERTSLSWTRTAISFAALGGAVLKANLVSGLVILAIAPVVWQLGRVTRGRDAAPGLPAVGATRLFVIAVTIVAVALLCLVIAVFGPGPPRRPALAGSRHSRAHGSAFPAAHGRAA